MLDPRIYRTGLIAAVLAAVVLAFSLNDQQAAVGTTLAPDAFNGQNAFATMNSLAATYPRRAAGSLADTEIADNVARQLSRYGFVVSRDSFRGQTVNGPRTLENVVGTRPGLSAGSIVVVAHRDSLGSPATADASGTAVLLELARVLAGETQQRTLVLASTSGSVGAAGARELARTLGRPVDAVLVLGDLAGPRVREPVLVPWSNGQVLAPPMLRNTVAASLSAQAATAAGQTSLASQFAHLAFPITVSEQGPFGARGEPALLLSLSGERPPPAGEATSATQISALGRTVLQTVGALDGAPSVPAPSAYLLFGGKVVPLWGIRLFVLALIVPVLMATIDGVARVRRRGHWISRWVVWVLSAGLPFVLAALTVLVARVLGLIGATPPGPVGAGAVPLHGADVVALALVGSVVVLAFVARRLLLRRLAGADRRTAALGVLNPGAAAAALLVLCLTALAIWVTNPFAALLLVPALHLWMWIVVPDLKLPGPAVAVLAAAGFALPCLVAAQYALALGLDPLQAAWSWVLLIGGGGFGLASAIEWSLYLGCAAAVITIASRSVRQPSPEPLPVTVRGPVTYAGPGSLGGTKSALRR
jgi:Peptidase family M28